MKKTAKLHSIWIKPVRKEAMKSMNSVQVIANTGIIGNAEQGGKRQITVIQKEVFDRIRSQLGKEIQPVMRRANFMISGLDLEESAGRILKIGDLRLIINGETKPCSRMDEAFPGLRKALETQWGGGVYGVPLNDAIVCTGDPVGWD